MKVPHLNEFLKRIIKAGEHENITVDFSNARSGYCSRKKVKIKTLADDRFRVQLSFSNKEYWNWDLSASSLEITGLKLRLVEGPTISLERNTSSSGVIQ